MTNSSASNKGLSHLGHLDRTQHSSINTLLLQSALESKGVNDGSQHAHVVPGSSIKTGLAHPDATDDISSPDNDRNFNVQLMNFNDLAGDIRHAKKTAMGP